MAIQEYGLYDKSKVTSGYFGETPKTEQSATDRLAALGLSSYQKEPEKVGFSLTDEAPELAKKDEGISGFTAETGEALEQRGENVSEIFTRFQEKNAKGANEIQEAFKNEGLGAAFEASMKKQLNTLGTAWQLVGQGAGAAGDVIWEAIENTTQKAIPEEAEQKLQSTIESIGDTETVQGLVESYQGFKERNPETAANLEATVNIGGFLLDLVGGKMVTKSGKELLETGVKSGKELVETGVEKVKTGADDLVSKAKATEPSDFAKNISGIDKQTENVLKNIDEVEYNKYIDIGKNAAEDIKNPTPMDIAGQEALDEGVKITNLKKQAGKEMGEIVKDNANIQVNTSELANNYKDFLKNRFNLEIDPDSLKLKTIAGKEAGTSDLTMLNKLNDDILAITTVDNIGIENFSSIGKRIKSNFDKILNERGVGSSLTADEKSVKGFILGGVDNELKNALPTKYAEKSSEFAKLLDIETRLSKLLGDKGDKGASFIKSTYSPQTGARMRRLSEEIKEITGIDLIDKAGLAKFAMQLSGDSRQANLLEALDLGTGFTSKLVERAKKVPLVGDLAELGEIGVRKVFPTEKVGRQLTK